MKNKYLRYTLKGFTILLSVLLILYIIVFAYVSVNKKKIILQVTEEISKKLNGTVSIENVELSFLKTFPSVSVALHNVKVTDTMFAQHHHPFFQGEDVYVKLGVFNMIRKKSFIKGLRIDNGSFYLFTDTSGYTNKYLFNPKKDSAAADNSNKRNELRSIVLNNVRLIEEDKLKNKFFDIAVANLDLDLEDKDQTAFLFSANANMLVHSLAFNLERGSFLKEKTFRGKFDFRFDKKLKQIQIDNADIKLADQLFNIAARFDMAGDNREFSLKLKTEDILYKEAKALLTHKIDSALSIGNVAKPLNVNASLAGPLKGGDPLIIVTFQTTSKTLLSTPFVDFENANFKGYFTNEVVAGLPRKDPNSKIVLTDFSATWQDLPVTSDRIQVINLLVPELSCDLQTHFALTKLNDVIGSNNVQLRSGEGSANISYKGPLQRNTNTNSFVNGFISLKNGTALYTPRDVELKNVNGRIIFKNSDVFVQNLQCVVLNNKIVMEGRALNLLTLIDAEPNKVNLDWNIYSPSLNLNAFTFLLKARKKVVVDPKAKGKVVKMANKIDRVLDQGIVAVSLKADHLIYKRFEAANALADIVLLQDRYIINNVSMEHAGGKMEIKGSMIAQNARTHNAKINAVFTNVDVSKTFAAFNNFGQDGITSQSLKGNLTAKIDASLNVDDEGKADPASIVSIIDFSLKNGELNNYEPIKKLQNIIFKNRDFENIKFAELKNRLEVKNGIVKINRMEIQSTVMSMFVEGVFSPKSLTDISIQVPLSNIHRPEADLNPVNIGTDKKVGRSIHLRGRPGPDGNIKFKLDLFNKFKKEKEENAGLIKE